MRLYNADLYSDVVEIPKFLLIYGVAVAIRDGLATDDDENGIL